MQSSRSIRNFLWLAFGMTAVACGSESTDDPKDAGIYTQSDSSITGDDTCDGKAVGTVERRVRYQKASVKGDAMCAPQDQMRTCEAGGTWSEWTGDYRVETCKVEGLASCDGMPHGTTQTRPRYESMTVPAGQMCKKQDQTRACEDGTWSAWSGNYTFEGCTVGNTTSCGNTPDGMSDTRDRYKATEVPFGQMCELEKQSNLCKMGTWAGWTGTFTAETCIVKEAQSCPNPPSTITVPHRSTVKRDRYKASLVEANETCEKEEQSATCSTPGAELKWSGSFEYEKCEVKGKRSCDGTPHNEPVKRTLYQSELVEFEAQCVSVEQTRLCKDGTFEAWSPVSTFTATTCKAKDPVGCSGGAAHNTPRTRLAYKEASPKFGTTCESVTQRSLCWNGTWQEYTGPAGYAALTCKVQDPAPCGTVAHGGTTTRTFYEKATVEFGATCRSQSQTGTCSNGTLTFPGPYRAEACTVAPAEPCPTNGARNERKLYEKATVPAGQTCRSQTQSQTCVNNKWTAWTPATTYSEPTCTVLRRSCSRGFNGGPDILDGESESRVRYEAAFPVTCKPETQTRRCNDGTFAAWSGTYKAVGCGPQLAPAAGVASCRQPKDEGARCREWTGPTRNNNKNSCTGAGNWDETRGCPTGGTTVGKCSGDLGAGPTADFHYDESAPGEISSCKLRITGTWTDL